MPITVGLPDGKTAQFPDGMSSDDIQKAIESDPTYGALPGVPKAPTPQGLTGPSSPNYAGAALATGNAIGNFVKGAAKGLGHTAATLGQASASGGGYPIPVSAQASPGLSDSPALKPTGTAQKTGYGLEQVGEFLVPGGAEERAASLAPKTLRPLARIGTAALSSGMVNAAQGGSPVAGAVMGAGGGAVGEGLRAVAPLVAESALGIRATDRAAGRKVGQAILGETTGVNAGKIADQANSNVNLYTKERNALAAQSKAPISLSEPRSIISSAQTEAASRNNPETIRRTQQAADLVNREFGSNAAIPPDVSASRALNLRQGLDELKGSWNPAVQNSFADAQIGKMRGSLSDAIHSAVPGTAPLDAKMSNLIPVAQRAGATDLNASSLQRILGRFTRPTGALLGGAAGADYGYHKGGLPSAALYGAAGMALPELIGSPTSQMLLARGMSNGATPTVRALLGGGLQVTSRNNLYGLK